MAFTIVYKPSAKRELAALPRRRRREIREEVQKLSSDPRALKNADWLRDEWEGDWKLVVGEYRVIYEINDRAAVVTIVRVGHRGEVYEGGPGLD